LWDRRSLRLRICCSIHHELSSNDKTGISVFFKSKYEIVPIPDPMSTAIEKLFSFVNFKILYKEEIVAMWFEPCFDLNIEYTNLE
jgi:hypothetical protein